MGRGLGRADLPALLRVVALDAARGALQLEAEVEALLAAGDRAVASPLLVARLRVEDDQLAVALRLVGEELIGALPLRRRLEQADGLLLHRHERLDGVGVALRQLVQPDAVIEEPFAPVGRLGARIPPAP